MTLREEFEKVKSALYVTAPFIASLLARARVVANRSVPIAAVSKRGVIIVNPDFWKQASWADRAWIVGHEVFHLAFRDHKRKGERDHGKWNVACDGVNNELLKELIKPSSFITQISITMDKLYEIVRQKQKIDYYDFVKLSKEELYKILPDIETDEGGDLGRGDEQGETVQDGDPSIYGEEGEGENADEEWKNVVAKAYDMQKTCGNIPAGLKRVVDELLKPKVSWSTLLRQAFRVGFGRTVTETWRRPSRKSDEYPGIRRYTHPTVWCLIDQSASINDREAAQFVSEVYAIAGDHPVKVISWDTVAYDIIEASDRNDVIRKVIRKLRGGGGTVIYNALEKTLDNMKFRDAVVVLTDGEIYDIDDDKTKQLFSAVASKASVAIIVSTSRELSIPGWRFIKLEI